MTAPVRRAVLLLDRVAAPFQASGARLVESILLLLRGSLLLLLGLLGLPLSGRICPSAAGTADRCARYGSVSGIRADNLTHYCPPRRATCSGARCGAGRGRRWC